MRSRFVLLWGLMLSVNTLYVLMTELEHNQKLLVRDWKRKLTKWATVEICHSRISFRLMHLNNQAKGVIPGGVTKESYQALLPQDTIFDTVVICLKYFDKNTKFIYLFHSLEQYKYVLFVKCTNTLRVIPNAYISNIFNFKHLL